MRYLKTILCVLPMLSVFMSLPAQAKPSEVQLMAAMTDYKIYVIKQLQQFVTHTDALASALKAANVSAAQELYVVTRVYYQHIEPAAISLHSLNQRIEGNSNNQLGFRYISNLLSRSDTDSSKFAKPAMQLESDVKTLQNELVMASFDTHEMLEGVLKEISENKRQSHAEMQLSVQDFLGEQYASLKGIEQLYKVLKPLVEQESPQLKTKMDKQLEQMNQWMGKYQSVAGSFEPLKSLKEGQRQVLAKQWQQLHGLVEQLVDVLL
ncbi:EfeM/EfeO family lipoprotein [Celerinatantimonas diazotrophica]|uniref:Imelysin n=1 Tax=Celerinatantimonas diazotrophica TaxID=412034 RepID=A0A4R1JLN1_9GAMM|nr:EfeM/EfeO family lipoprotein [Celerinatantimonas diazotrophica]TCK51943.1 imelysin [Celerinatantimonas diazotrophica]CAG9296358.1 Iron uptake system component EfeO [Celerinatantimonas diazotrophica]